MNFSRGSAASRAAVWLPELALLGFTPLIFYRGFTEQFTYIKLVLTEAIVLLAAIILVLIWIWGFLRWPKDFGLAAPLGWLALAVLTSCFTSPLPPFSLVEAQYFLCGPLWLAFLVAWGGGESRVRWLSGLVATAAAVMAVIALPQWAGHDPLQFGGYHVEWGTLRRSMRLYSTLGNPNFVAGYLIGAIFPAIALAATVRKKAARALAGMAAVAIFTAILGTRSRGAWLGLVAGLVIARMIWKRHVSAEPSAVPPRGEFEGLKLASWLPLTGLAFMLPDLAQQARALFSHLEGRLCLSRASWPMFAEHPLFGSGWGMFQLRFPELQAQFLSAHPECIRYWTHTRQIHNDPLQILYEAGAVAFVAMAWLLWRYGREVRQGAAAGSRATRMWLGASAGGVTAVLVNSLFNFQFAIPPALILLFTLLAIPQLLKSGEGNIQIVGVSPFGVRLLASACALGVGVVLCLGTARRAAADHALALGLEQERKGEIARAEQHFRHGLTRTPDDGRLHYGLARALYVQGQYPAALAEVLRAEPTVADSHLEVLRARIMDQMGYASPAVAAYRHALWLNPALKSVRADIERLEGESRGRSIRAFSI